MTCVFIDDLYFIIIKLNNGKFKYFNTNGETATKPVECSIIILPV